MNETNNANASNLKRFVEQLNDMLEKLIKICPDNKDLRVYYLKFDAIRSLNSQLIILVFIKYIYPYRNYIMGDRNSFEQFVKGVDLHKEISGNDQIMNDIQGAELDNNLVLTKALNLKSIWENNLNDANKEVLFTYFQVLIKLCERYIAGKIKNN